MVPDSRHSAAPDAGRCGCCADQGRVRRGGRCHRRAAGRQLDTKGNRRRLDRTWLVRGLRCLPARGARARPLQRGVRDRDIPRGAREDHPERRIRRPGVGGNRTPAWRGAAAAARFALGRVLGIGGATGLGSLIYGLAALSRLLGDDEAPRGSTGSRRAAQRRADRGGHPTGRDRGKRRRDPEPPAVVSRHPVRRGARSCRRVRYASAGAEPHRTTGPAELAVSNGE